MVHADALCFRLVSRPFSAKRTCATILAQHRGASSRRDGHNDDLRRTPIMGSTRRNILATGAAATAMAAAQRVLAQQTGKGGAAMPVYEKGPVRIHYEEAGSGFPLLLIAGGGLDSTISGLTP